MNKVSLLLLLFLSAQTFAQVSSDSSTNIGDVTITTELEVNVADAHKIKIEPELEEPKTRDVEYKYSFPGLSYKPRAVYSPIDPVFLKPEDQGDYFDNYIELGMGNYLTSFVDARIHNTRDPYYTYGLQVQHRAASRSKNPDQGLYSYNRVKAFGMRERGNTLSGDIDYQRNVIHYYGYLDSLNPELKDIDQIYNDIGANAHWNTSKRGVNSSIDFGFNIFDRLQGNEVSVQLENSNAFKAGRNTFHLDLGGMYTSLNQANTYNRTFIDFYPHYAFRYKRFQVDAGFIVTAFLDSNTREFKAAPRVKAHTYLVPDKLKAYAGLDGGLQKSTLRSLSYENLFLGNELRVQNPYEVFKIYAGMNGYFKRFVEYGIQLSQSVMRNQHLFITDTNELRNMQLLYDSLNIFTFVGELKLDINENLDIGAVVKAYSYSTNSQDAAWQLPTYDAKIFATIRLVEKIYFSASYFGISSRPAINYAGERTNLPAIHDINLGFEYRYKKNISGFVNVQNLLNQRYFLWNNYRSQGLNFLAGVTFSL